jgi:translation elongation factor EF-1alpha
VVIVVNKMDATISSPWNSERYYRIESEVRQFLVNDLNFHDKLVRCVPLSGLTAENLISMSNECPGRAWYHGITLQAALDTFHIPPKQLDKAFRAVVTDVKTISRMEVEMQVCALQGKLVKGRSVGIASYSHSHCKLTAARVSSIKSLPGDSEMNIESEITQINARERVSMCLTSRFVLS